MAWAEKWKNVNWRFFIHANIIPITILFAITLAGCLPGLQQIFLVKFSVPGTNSTSFPDLRVGQFGLCGGVSSNLICLSSQSTTASALTSKFRQYSAELPDDAESFVQFAMALQGRIFPPLLAASGVLFSLGLLSLALLKMDIRKGPNASPQRTERYRKWTILCLWAATGLTLASAVGVAQTAGGIQFATKDTVRVPGSFNDTVSGSDHFVGDLSSTPVSTADPSVQTIEAGETHQILQWLLVASLFIFSVGVSSMHNQPFIGREGDPYSSAQKGASILPMSGPRAPPPPPPPPPPPAVF